MDMIRRFVHGRIHAVDHAQWISAACPFVNGLWAPKTMFTAFYTVYSVYPQLIEYPTLAQSMVGMRV